MRRVDSTFWRNVMYASLCAPESLVRRNLSCYSKRCEWVYISVWISTQSQSSILEVSEYQVTSNYDFFFSIILIMQIFKFPFPIRFMRRRVLQLMFLKEYHHKPVSVAETNYLKERFFPFLSPWLNKYSVDTLHGSVVRKMSVKVCVSWRNFSTTTDPWLKQGEVRGGQSLSQIININTHSPTLTGRFTRFRRGSLRFGVNSNTTIDP